MDKYQEAISEYEHWRQQVNQLSQAIGDAANWYCDETGRGGPRCENIDIEGGETCVSRYWAANKQYYDPEHDQYIEPPEKIAMCKSCHEVDRLVAERKTAKLQFGIAKRRISQMGKTLLRRPPA